MLVKIGQRGTITLPRELRKGLDGNTVLEAVRRDDGVIELRPKILVDASEAWFWTEQWQQMEREADEDIAAGRVRTAPDVETFIAMLEEEAGPAADD